MNLYRAVSKGYDLLDRIYFAEKGTNPREVIKAIIPDSNVTILDMCCGTLSNTLSIAEKYPKSKVYGIDLSKDMLSVARKKCRRKQVENVALKCANATSTGLKSGIFDYIVIGLVLHESSPELRKGILEEAYRLLKKDGSLIILEWERQDPLLKQLKFAPLCLGEKLNCRYFNDFYQCDKEEYFKQYNMNTVELTHCNYSVVMRLKKMKDKSGR